MLRELGVADPSLAAAEVSRFIEMAEPLVQESVDHGGATSIAAR